MLDPALDAYTLGVISGALAAARNTQSTLALQMMDKYANTSGKKTFRSGTVLTHQKNQQFSVANENDYDPNTVSI